MAAEYFFVYDSGYGQTVEAVRERFPQFDVVSSFAFVVEAVYAVDGGTLVVAAQKKKVFWEFYFVGQKKAYGLERLFAAVDVVA